MINMPLTLTEEQFKERLQAAAEAAKPIIAQHQLKLADISVGTISHGGPPSEWDVSLIFTTQDEAKRARPLLDPVLWEHLQPYRPDPVWIRFVDPVGVYD
jgi:hypothetical protein